MREPTYYDVLGVGTTATTEEIDAAWKALIREHHPDRFPDGQRATAEARSKIINEAHQALADVERRSRYDRRQSVPRRTPRSTFQGDPVEILLEMRAKRKREAVRTMLGGVAGIAGIYYTLRSFKVLP